MLHIDKDCWFAIIGVWVATLLIVGLLSFFIRNKYVVYPLWTVSVVFLCFVVWFHRVPERESPASEDSRLITSVADGKVVIIEKTYEPEYLKRECMQVSVYMNFFDVHANFWPMNGEISYYKYHPGKYFLAFLPKASDLNEHSSTAIANEHGEIFFKQIAGTFARRIVCYSEEGAKTVGGEQCGIIKFGSRIDMFLPLDTEIKVKIGDLTKACETVIAELK